MKKICCLIFLVSFCFASQHEHYPLRLDISAFYHNRDDFFGEIDLLLPFIEAENKLLFGNIRGINYAKQKFEGNFGLGFRFIHHDWIYGLYTFYDCKKSDFSKFFSQITFGIEAKTSRFTFGSNGYLPVGKKQKRVNEFDHITLIDGTLNFKNILFVQGAEVALYGFDAEVGYELISGLRVFAGGFYFHRKTALTLTGPMGRIEFWIDANKDSRLSFFDKIQLEGGLSYDRVRKSRFYGGVRFSWLLGKSRKTFPKGLKRRMLDYVRRDYNVITESNSKKTPTLLTKSNGSPVNISIVTNKTEFDNALLANADVIAVQGSVVAATTIALANSNLYVTGGQYTFNEDMSIVLSTGGDFDGADDLFLLTGNNYTFRDLIFTTPNNKYAFTNSSQLGQVTFESNTFTSPTLLFVGKNQNSFNVSLSNNMINVPIIEKSLVTFRVEDNAQISIPLVYNNSFSSSQELINETPMLFFEALSENATINVGSIRNNQFTSSNQTTLLMPLAILNRRTAGPATTQLIRVEEIVGNTFDFSAASISPNATSLLIYVRNADFVGGSTQTIQVGKMNSNQMKLTNQTEARGFYFDNIGGGANAPLTTDIKELLHNQIEYNIADNIGIFVNNVQAQGGHFKIGEGGGFFGNKFTTLGLMTNNIELVNPTTETSATIEIVINRGTDSLSVANHDATVATSGKGIEIKER